MAAFFAYSILNAMANSAAAPPTKRNLGVVLTVAMIVAMLMGPGPGLRLVNPDITEPGADYLVFGLPIIYAWGLLWFVVQVAIVLIAYFTVWKTDDTADESTEAVG